MSVPSCTITPYPLLPFGITGRALRPMVHTASVIGTEVPIWDIAARFDETDMLVRSMEQGRDLAATLGSNACVLMRGHGAVVAAGSLKQAVMIAIYLKLNAEVQLQAMAIGTPRGLSEREVRALPRDAVLAARPRPRLGVFSACAPASIPSSCGVLVAPCHAGRLAALDATLRHHAGHGVPLVAASSGRTAVPGYDVGSNGQHRRAAYELSGAADRAPTCTTTPAEHWIS